MTKSVLAYAAGVMDGEGSISISRNKFGRLRAEIEMTTTDPYLAKFFKEHFGGFTLVRKRKQYNPKWTDANMWSITGVDNISRFLGMIEPFMLVKKERAQLVIQFCKSRSGALKKPRYDRGFTSTEERLYQRVKALQSYSQAS